MKTFLGVSVYVFIMSLLLNAIVCFNIAYGASVNRTEVVGSFIVNVIQDGEPVKEIDGNVVIPFDSEYELLIKNNNNRRAVAKVTIDGANISSHGDIVIPANSEIKLERFITDSLTEGRRFKFVSLDHPEVDDPGREENGVIRVEFQVEEKRGFIMSDEGWTLPADWEIYTVPCVNDLSALGQASAFVSDDSAQLGATIGGSNSDQKFHKVEIDLEDEVWVIELRMKGL